MKKVIAYFRSGDPKNKTALEKFAKENKLEIIETFSDPASDKSIGKEKGFAAAIFAAEKKKIGEILVFSSGQIAGSSSEIEILEIFIKRRGIELNFILPSSYIEDDGFYSVDGIVNAALDLEKDFRSSRLQISRMLTKKRTGFPPAPIEHIEMAVALRKQGLSYSQMASRMFDVGMYAARGYRKAYNPGSIKHLLDLEATLVDRKKLKKFSA